MPQWIQAEKKNEVLEEIHLVHIFILSFFKIGCMGVTSNIAAGLHS
jgi:hypothetical protein